VLDTLKETRGGGIYPRATGQLIWGRHLLPPWELEARRACVPIVEEWRAALDDEGAAWEEWERARRNAADTLPIDEIEAARERLAAAKAGGGEPEAGHTVAETMPPDTGTAEPKGGGKPEAPAEIPPKAGKGGEGKRHNGRPGRGKYEVTQEEAAKRLGVDVRTLRRWEAGGAVPRNAEGYTKDKRRTQAGFAAYVVGLRRDLSTVENLRAGVETIQLGNRMGMGTRKRP
jgi:DNA-binding XRE family transcriptional regulator